MKTYKETQKSAAADGQLIHYPIKAVKIKSSDQCILVCRDSQGSSLQAMFQTLKKVLERDSVTPGYTVQPSKSIDGKKFSVSGNISEAIQDFVEMKLISKKLGNTMFPELPPRQLSP